MIMLTYATWIAVIGSQLKWDELFVADVTLALVVVNFIQYMSFCNWHIPEGKWFVDTE